MSTRLFRVFAASVPRGDPTRTNAIVRRYQRDMLRRWRELDRVVFRIVAKDDILGLSDAIPGLRLQVAPPSRFDFPSDLAGKADAFDTWLRGAIDSEVLRPAGWSNSYVRAAYSKGVTHADRALRAQGIVAPPGSLEQTFNAPIHRDKLRLLYSRNFNLLRGIGEAQAAGIASILTEGLATGQNPLDMAREMRQSFTKIGRNRSVVLARTEIIRAHAESSLNRFQQAGIQEVSGRAESVQFSTAGDDRVCPDCAGIDGNTYTIDEARGIIPLHPQCRCAWLPVI